MSYAYNLETFKEARPVNTFVKIALAGPQNSGKTVSALRIAAGLGGKTAVLDTENKRSLKYAGSFKFDHLSIDPPFSAENYEAAIAAAVKAGYQNIIVDSMSHEHEGPGGMLDQVDTYLKRKTEDITDEKAKERKKDQLKFSAFIVPKQARTRLIQFGIQRVPANIILCFRAKEKTAMIKEKWVSADGMKSGEKNVPTPIGLQPIGGEEFYFEMDVLIMLTEGGNGKPDWTQTAARINEFPAGRMTSFLHDVEQLNEDVGAKLKEFNTVDPFLLRTGRGLQGFKTATDWNTAALEVVGRLTTKAHFETFTSINGAGLQAVKEADAGLYEGFMSTFMSAQKKLEIPAATSDTLNL